jgi:sensor domain CHASE-containing protein
MPVMRKVLIVGLIVLAALLPLAPPLAIFVLDVPFVVVDAAPSASADAQSVAFLALTLSRAPPLR